MSRKADAMRRKFSFDIPHLKLGPSKVDKKQLKSPGLPIDLDSPPQTPRSVRPPLSPRVDNELRLACAYVLADFKPTTRIFEENESEDGHESPQWDFTPTEQLAHNQMELTVPPVHHTLANMRTKSMQTDLTMSEEDEEMHSYSKRVSVQRSISEGQSSQFAFEDNSLLARAERLRLSQTFQTNGVKTHRRSISNPLNSCLMNSVADLIERPQTAPRPESRESTNSTPQTEGTDFVNGSTAPTSAAFTPAHSSQRTSSHLLQSEINAAPKFLASETNWMRQELEKHRKAQEEALAQQELENQVLNCLGMEAAPSHAGQASISWTKIPARKPVPRATPEPRQPSVSMLVEEEGTEQGSLRPESNTIPAIPFEEAASSPEIVRSNSRRQRATPRSESTQEIEMLRPESRHRLEESRPATRDNNELKIYFRPESELEPLPPNDDTSRSRSWSRNRHRPIQDYLPHDSGMESSSVSVDISRCESRSRSIDSTRSEVSALAPSEASSSSRWRNFSIFHRRDDSLGSLEFNRPDSASSSYRDSIPELKSPLKSPMSPQRKLSKTKPTINLNRELPPLPSLDSWKPVERELEPEIQPEVEPESPEKPRHIISMASSKTEHTRNESQMTGTTLFEKQEDDIPRVASPTVFNPHKLSGEGRRLEQRSPELPAPPKASTRIDSTAMFAPFDLQLALAPPKANRQSVPTSPLLPVHPPPAKEPKRSKSIQALGQAAKEKKLHIFSSSRTNRGAASTDLTRKASKREQESRPPAHDRSKSEQPNFSRKLTEEQDRAARDRTKRYQNTVELKPAPKKAATAPLPPPPKEKPKKRWWSKSSFSSKKDSWMDQVVKSGANSGMITSDHMAKSPIVRY